MKNRNLIVLFTAGLTANLISFSLTQSIVSVMLFLMIVPGFITVYKRLGENNESI